MHLRVDGGEAGYGNVLSKEVTIATARQVLVPDVGFRVELHHVSVTHRLPNIQ